MLVGRRPPGREAPPSHESRWSRAERAIAQGRHLRPTREPQEAMPARAIGYQGLSNVWQM
jgi:hypothetical protein